MKTIFVLALTITASAAILGAASSPGQPAPASPTDEELVDRFLRSDRPALTSYRAYRRLEASTRGGKMTAWLETWTSLDADGTFHFEVVRESGSELIRNRVLRKALETEQGVANDREASQVRLTRDNYDFQMGADEGDLATIGLLPRRSSPMLLNGTVTVTRPDGDVVRIGGRLSETPSWWTRRVDIVQRYARVNGVRVPVEMSSRADVRVAGDSTFLMTYRYVTINGVATDSGASRSSAN